MICPNSICLKSPVISHDHGYYSESDNLEVSNETVSSSGIFIPMIMTTEPNPVVTHKRKGLRLRKLIGEQEAVSPAIYKRKVLSWLKRMKGVSLAPESVICDPTRNQLVKDLGPLRDKVINLLNDLSDVLDAIRIHDATEKRKVNISKTLLKLRQKEVRRSISLNSKIKEKLAGLNENSHNSTERNVDDIDYGIGLNPNDIQDADLNVVLEEINIDIFDIV